MLLRRVSAFADLAKLLSAVGRLFWGEKRDV